MTIALLDINDCNLQLWNGDTHLQSPGYALLQGKQYRFGAPARAAARLQPRDINTRYWWQLSTEALQPALGPARHTGDLVHAHLQELHREAGQPAEIMLAVSAGMQREQLALLLGIVQQCPFDAVGLVSRSVALGSLYSGSGRLFHLEIQLHQAIISEMEESAGRIELQRTVPLPGCGLLQLQERLVEIIAAAFIRQTRFDPRRKADTEQQLYDSLPQALRTLGSEAETNLEVKGYRARINRSDLLPAGQRLFDSAPQSMGTLRPDDRIIVDPIANLLPGLGERLPSMHVAEPGAVREALQRHQQQLVQRGQALSFVTSLPCLEVKITPSGSELIAPPQEAPSAPPPRLATHLLQDTVARPLSAAGSPLDNDWELLLVDGYWQLRGPADNALVNGIRYQQGQRLACGDTLAIGAGSEYMLIEVVP